jgi:hypothetical protein
MKRLNARQRLFVGAALLAAGVWGVDALTRGGKPTAASAGPSAAGSTVAEGAPRWKDIGDEIRRLTGQRYSSIAAEVGALERDLFLPTAELGAVLAPPEPDETQTGEAARPKISPEDDFGARHRLVGVMLGPRPLAVIDDRVLAVNSELEGYRLVEVQRDFVTFVHPVTRVRVKLEVAKGPGTP